MPSRKVGHIELEFTEHSIERADRILASKRAKNESLESMDRELMHLAVKVTNTETGDVLKNRFGNIS